MSRYLRVAVDATREELERGFAALGIVAQTGPAGERIMLAGSFECAGEPVDLRFPAGTLGSVEDFGFVDEEGGTRLVCGDVDRAQLEARLLAPLRARKLGALAERLGREQDLEVDEELHEDGSRRLVLRRR